MKIQHITTPRGPLTIAIGESGTSRFPGTLTLPDIERQLRIYNAIDAQQKKANNPCLRLKS